VLRLPDLKYPNRNYQKVLTKLSEYFKAYHGVYAILLTGSLARSKAVEGSCIDLSIFLGKKQIDALASTLKFRAMAYSQLDGEICHHEGKVEGGVLFGDIRVDVIFTDGNLDPRSENSFDITRDEFETTIGNLFVYSVILYEEGTRYEELKSRYLPFYNNELRRVRLKGTREEFAYKIWKTKWLAERGEYLSSLETLLEAQRIFLQHLFIKRRKYPIDYVKWIKEQCTKILRMPSLYQELISVVNGIELNKKGVTNKASILEELFLKNQ